jgi:hypothetical protein
MGKMKELYIEIVQSRKYKEADWQQRSKMLREWQESDEFKNKIKDGIDRYKRR